MPIEKQADAERLAQLRRRVRPLLLRRTKEQVASDLPDKQEQVLELDLNPKHKKIYQTYLQRERQKVLGLLDDVHEEPLRHLPLPHPAPPGQPRRVAHRRRARRGALDQARRPDGDARGHRRRRAPGPRVQPVHPLPHPGPGSDRRTAGIDHCYLDGRTRNRDGGHRPTSATVHAPVFLISLKAGGFGLNLTEADYCILLDPWWNPATEAQAVDRIHRIGQTRKVMVYRLVAKDTLEEKVMALKAKKAALFANVMDAGGFESGAMTAADIRDLLS